MNCEGKCVVTTEPTGASTTVLTAQMHLPAGTTGAQLMGSKAFTDAYKKGLADSLMAQASAVTITGIMMSCVFSQRPPLHRANCFRQDLLGLCSGRISSDVSPRTYLLCISMLCCVPAGSPRTYLSHADVLSSPAVKREVFCKCVVERCRRVDEDVGKQDVGVAVGMRRRYVGYAYKIVPMTRYLRKRWWGDRDRVPSESFRRRSGTFGHRECQF